MIKCNTPDCKYNEGSECIKTNINIYGGECKSEKEIDEDYGDED